MSRAEVELQRLIDLEAIRDLARRYGHYVWQKDLAAAVDLFTEDGEMHTGERPPIIGREKLLEVYGQMIEGYMLNPFMHSHIVDIDGDEATGTCYLDLRIIRDGQSMIGSGYYDDCYLRVDGEWKIKSRRLTMKYLVKPGDSWDSEEQF